MLLPRIGQSPFAIVQLDQHAFITGDYSDQGDLTFSFAQPACIRSSSEKHMNRQVLAFLLGTEEAQQAAENDARREEKSELTVKFKTRHLFQAARHYFSLERLAIHEVIAQTLTAVAVNRHSDDYEQDLYAVFDMIVARVKRHDDFELLKQQDNPQVTKDEKERLVAIVQECIAQLAEENQLQKLTVHAVSDGEPAHIVGFIGGTGSGKSSAARQAQQVQKDCTIIAVDELYNYLMRGIDVDARQGVDAFQLAFEEANYIRRMVSDKLALQHQEGRSVNLILDTSHWSGFYTAAALKMGAELVLNLYTDDPKLAVDRIFERGKNIDRFMPAGITIGSRQKSARQLTHGDVLDESQLYGFDKRSGGLLKYLQFMLTQFSPSIGSESKAEEETASQVTINVFDSDIQYSGQEEQSCIAQWRIAGNDAHLDILNFRAYVKFIERQLINKDAASLEEIMPEKMAAMQLVKKEFANYKEQLAGFSCNIPEDQLIQTMENMAAGVCRHQIYMFQAALLPPPAAQEAGNNFSAGS